jgi:nucleoid-associated protein YgaU
MIREPDRTATGMAGPASSDAGTHTRYHIVKRGETLAMIATAYFGDPALAQAVFEANCDVLAAPDAVVSGQTLRIPQGFELNH